MQNQKTLHVVSGIIYDDEYAALHGGNRFYHLNGDIETDRTGMAVYVESHRKDNSSETIEKVYPVKDMPKLVQRYIKKYTQPVEDREKVQYICVHSSELLETERKKPYEKTKSPNKRGGSFSCAAGQQSHFRNRTGANADIACYKNQEEYRKKTSY